MMNQIDIRIVEVGVNIEIKLTINGLPFYSHYGFGTVQQAKDLLNAHNLQETTQSGTHPTFH